jgi:hypothetical protein
MASLTFRSRAPARDVAAAIARDTRPTCTTYILTPARSSARSAFRTWLSRNVCPCHAFTGRESGFSSRASGRAAARAEWVVAPVLQKMFGSLPVTAEFCRRLGIAEIIDVLCPLRDVASSRVTHGQTAEALIANRLTSPRSMVQVSQ